MKDILSPCRASLQSEAVSEPCAPENPRQNRGENPKDRVGSRKPPLHLIPPAAEVAESLVMALGARKYGPFNWRTANVKASIYIAAARRHLLQWFDGQDDDPESGVSHLAHARACLGILLDALATGHLVDDRPPPGAAAELMERYQRQHGEHVPLPARIGTNGKPRPRPESVDVLAQFVDRPPPEEIPDTPRLIFAIGSMAIRLMQSGWLSADQFDDLGAWLRNASEITSRSHKPGCGDMV